MKKTILLTGATDGIGFETAKLLATQGHTLLLHGRNASKLAQTKETLLQLNKNLRVESFKADFANLVDVDKMAFKIKHAFTSIDVLINNAGVFKSPVTVTDLGYDIRFIVNTVASYLLSQKLLPLFNSTGRVINLSSAAQAPVNLNSLKGEGSLSDSDAYAQSKLALTMWTFLLANLANSKSPAYIAVNPASFLGSKMVKEAYGSQGKDLQIGADILVRAALSDEFADATGKYFDNDRGNWSQPHADALDQEKNTALQAAIEEVLGKLGVAVS